MNNLPYQPNHDAGSVELHVFRASLVEAISLFSASRKEALIAVYKSKELFVTEDVPIAADFEEVAASCGQFASSLQDFGENCVKYMEVLEELQTELTKKEHGLSWTWLLFWRTNPYLDPEQLDHGTGLTNSGETVTNKMQSDARRRPHKDTAALSQIQKPGAEYQPNCVNSDAESVMQQFPYSFYPYVRFWGREDIRFAVKVGGGAALYAMFAFIPGTRDFYDEWHLEWGLVAYMIVSHALA